MAAPRRSTRSRQVEAEEPAISPPAAGPTHSPPRKRKRSFQAETAPVKSEAPEAATEGDHLQAAAETTEAAAAAPAASPTPPSRKNAKVVKLKRPTRGTAATTATAVDGKASQGAEGQGDDEAEEEGESSGSRASPGATMTAAQHSGSQPLKTSEDYILPREQELWLQAADAEKLRTVAKHLMPELLEAPLPPESNFAKQSTGVKGKSKEKILPSSTLLQALDGRRVSLRQLRVSICERRYPDPPTYLPDIVSPSLRLLRWHSASLC